MCKLCFFKGQANLMNFFNVNWLINITNLPFLFVTKINNVDNNSGDFSMSMDYEMLVAINWYLYVLHIIFIVRLTFKK